MERSYLQFWKIVQNLRQFIMNGLLSEFDLSRIKLTNPRNLIMLMDHGRRFSLGL